MGMASDTSGFLKTAIQLLNERGSDELYKKLEDELRQEGPDAIISKLVELTEISQRHTQLLGEILLRVSALDIGVVNETVQARSLARKVVLDATQAFSRHHGLMDLEYADDGTPFRWTGGQGGNCVFTLNIDRSVERVIVVTFFAADVIRQQLETHRLVGVADGAGLKFESFTLGNLARFTTVLGKTEQSTPTDLVLQVPLTRPEDAIGQPAGSTLGWPFVSLIVE